ncbi:alpha/beta hydrolase family protein [Lysobacter sp. CA199]|uniref:alpha/beta hydrolase family protein n=1 Tax=Lysobacter sp. CA199 TaxID=3455608 RepID=UPI003F8D0BA6
MPDAIDTADIDLRSKDGHRWSLTARVPANPSASLLWVPALGIAARHYAVFADALAARGIAVFVHEWRGNGSSSLRPSRDSDWGYRELLLDDLPVSDAAAAATLPGVPRIIGGHSLGGQFACMRLGMASLQGDPAMPRSLWLVASGAPYWRTWPMPSRIAMPMLYRFLPWLAQVNGTLPGRRLKFAGTEARSLIRDWALTAISGRYAVQGIETDLEVAMAQVEVDARAVTIDRDWLVPKPSLEFLLSKLPRSHAEILILSERDLGTRADHFAWMKQPDAVVNALLRE